VKIRTLYNNLDINHLIVRAINNERIAQTELYNRFAPKMLSVCRYYTKDLQYAEDVMIRGFMKAFQNLKKFNNMGSFEGWLRKIMTREAIDFLRAHKSLDFTDNLESLLPPPVLKSKNKEHTEEYLQRCIDQLPDGYRVVFVLYAIEGYSHKEISKKLEISIGTSKSQLFKARKMLQKIVQIEEKEVGYGK